MRAPVLALALALSTIAPAAWAASIKSDNTLGCRDLETHDRLGRIAAQGDRAGVVALVKQVLASGQCVAFDTGERVRLERGGFTFSCVAPFGSAAPCVWVQSRSVNVRD